MAKWHTSGAEINLKNKRIIPPADRSSYLVLATDLEVGEKQFLCQLKILLLEHTTYN